MTRVHVIGMGGVGMSAVAHIALDRGYEVSGSDIRRNFICNSLLQKGAKLFLGHSSDVVPAQSKVVYSTAIAHDNVEIIAAHAKGCRLLHRSEFLEEMMQSKRQLVVTGAHGKTTISSLLSYVLRLAEEAPSFAVGGYTESLTTNGCWDQGEYFVLEGDESDGSFLRTQPDGAILTSTDIDHIDYWGDAHRLSQAYGDFIQSVKYKEQFLYCIDNVHIDDLFVEGVSYGVDQKANIRLINQRYVDNRQYISFFFYDQLYRDIEISLIGRHNALNVLAVFGLSRSLGIPEGTIFQAFSTFSSVYRRLQHRGIVHGVTYIDDYAHHPVAVQHTLAAVHESLGNRRLIVVFQPHRYSRFAHFYREFARVLEKEEVIVTDIYGAGEDNPGYITSADLLGVLGNSTHVRMISREEIKHYLHRYAKAGDTVLTLGAGDITHLKEEVASVI